MPDAIIDLKGVLEMFPKSKDTLSPLYEAITNSIESFSGKNSFGNENPFISIQLHYTKNLTEVSFKKLIIEDNGIGFNRENFGRFERLLDKSKKLNNRGSGRIQYLHRFNSIEIESVYFEENEYKQKCFTFSCESNITNGKETIKEPKTTSTKLILSELKIEKENSFYNNLDLSELKNRILYKFILKFHLTSNLPEISISSYHDKDEYDSKSITKDDIPKPYKSNEFEVYYLKNDNSSQHSINWIEDQQKKEIIKWSHFKIAADKLDKNAIYLCSKNISVEKLNFDEIDDKTQFGGYRYLTAFYGDYFENENIISHSSDQFMFPKQDETENKIAEELLDHSEESYIFDNYLKDKINNELFNIYDDLIHYRTELDVKIKGIAKRFGFSEDIIKETPIKLNDDEDKIRNKLFKKQAEKTSEQSKTIITLFDSLNEMDPRHPNYHDNLLKKSYEILHLIPEQNREELSRYIIRREMVADLLGKILDNSLDVQTNWETRDSSKRRDNEALIHDLIFKRSSKNDGLNDLWILNEEYVHFSGYSDIRLNEIVINGKKIFPSNIEDEKTLKSFNIDIGKQRPDIFLFPEEGNAIIIELKAPDVDVSDHLDQITKYCKLIANNSIIPIPITRFYGYLIGEDIDKRIIPDRYSYSKYGGFWFYPNENIKDINGENIIANIYQEIIKLSSIKERAKLRNKSFADKLGLKNQP